MREGRVEYVKERNRIRERKREGKRARRKEREREKEGEREIERERNGFSVKRKFSIYEDITFRTVHQSVVPYFQVTFKKNSLQKTVYNMHINFVKTKKKPIKRVLCIRFQSHN